MARNIALFVYSVKDVDKAKTFYGQFLDTEPYAESPYYVGFRVGDQEIGLTPTSDVAPIAYVDVEDVKGSLEAMTEAGGEIAQDVSEVSRGVLIAQVKDADGNVVGLRQQAG